MPSLGVLLLKFKALLKHSFKNLFRSKIAEYLCSDEIQQSTNIIHIQSSSIPYSLLTSKSRIPIILYIWRKLKTMK